jgi:endonuclease YncB( thermonuclease family)
MNPLDIALSLLALGLLVGSLYGLARFAKAARWQREHRRLLAMRPGAVPAAPSPPGPAGTFVRVVRVIDGDTVRVSVLGGHDTVRVLGVDAPETKHPDLPVQRGGREAAAFAHRQLHGRRVMLVSDAGQPDRDRYGRLLRYVQLPDGSDFSTNLAAAGWARSVVYGRPAGGAALPDHSGRTVRPDCPTRHLALIPDTGT